MSGLSAGPGVLKRFYRIRLRGVFTRFHRGSGMFLGVFIESVVFFGVFTESVVFLDVE